MFTKTILAIALVLLSARDSHALVDFCIKHGWAGKDISGYGRYRVKNDCFQPFWVKVCFGSDCGVDRVLVGRTQEWLDIGNKGDGTIVACSQAEYDANLCKLY